jgi:GNAT superfamily N-acetyltransferase
VEAASVRTVLAATDGGPAGGVGEEVTDDWLQAWVEITGIARLATVAAEMVRRVGPRAGYARFPAEGEALSVGRAVCERGRVGVFAMATRPDARRRGAARAVLHALAEWAHRVGAASLYLQVDVRNGPARNLYASAGFERVYEYHYREAG